MAPDKKDQPQSNSEITVSATGVTVKGQLVDSMSKPVMRLATTADSVLRFCSSLVVLPFDFMSHNLESFRRRYAHKFEEIPFEHRQEPSARIAATAIQQAALSADAPDIQEMFAQLLASASDARLQGQVHPAFVSVISQLDANDAVFLQAVAAATAAETPVHLGDRREELREIASAATANLLRIRIFETRDLPYNTDELNRLVGRSHYAAPRDWSDGLQTLVSLINDVQKLKNELVNKLGQQHARQATYISPFGQSFIRVVLGELPTLDSIAIKIEI
ncbi:Abi-alpha family protein [Variovorax sp. E3]|uniref:Abi-alpha family protein n=1 Tax=Variovorax sp. E3 TaxID=1914993 RepID=UPI0018DB5C5C|nr:Abi-alpha family protein [Variovorax sp. E3]